MCVCAQFYLISLFYVCDGCFMMVFPFLFHIKATKNSRSISGFLPQSFCHSIFPLHLASHCCCLAFIVVVCIALYTYYVNNLRLSSASLCMATTLRWRTASCRQLTRTHAITFNECEIHKATHSIYFVFLSLSLRTFSTHFQHHIETTTPARKKCMLSFSMWFHELSSIHFIEPSQLFVSFLDFFDATLV